MASRTAASGATITSTVVKRLSISHSCRSVSTRPSYIGGHTADGVKSSSTTKPPGSTTSAMMSRADSFASRASTNSRANGPRSISAVQSAETTSIRSSAANSSATTCASCGSLSAVTIRVLSPAPLRSQAEPTPQPVPSSPSRPVFDAASVASSRPVSFRVELTNPRRPDRLRAADTSGGSSGGALTG